MRLATIRDGSRDGALVLVRADGARCLPAPASFPTLQAALDRWTDAQPLLAELAARLDRGDLTGSPVDATTQWGPPLPRAYEWVDGSAFLQPRAAGAQVRGARNRRPTLTTDPLVYQGGSGVLLGPTDPLAVRRSGAGASTSRRRSRVILGDVPRGTDAARGRPAASAWSACSTTSPCATWSRAELAKGFGFLQSKPATAFAPVRGHARRARPGLARRPRAPAAALQPQRRS